MNKFLPLIVFVVLSALAVELSYRVYALGPMALNPFRLNSMRTLLESGLVQPAADRETYFELQPDLDTLHNGAPLTTNSAGLADLEYTLEKPPGVYRVAVVGSSWTMPTSVEHQQAWHAQLEQRLNKGQSGRRYEFINFGVELYGLGEIAGTLKHKVMAYDPDLILVGLTLYSAYIVRENNPEPFVAPPVRHPFFESFALRALDGALGLDWFDSRQRRTTFGTEMGDNLEQSRQFLLELAAYRDTHDVDLAIVWLGFRPIAKKYGAMVRATTAELGIPLVIGYRGLLRDKVARWGDSFALPEYQASRFDPHPNAAGHAKIADEVEAALFSDARPGAGESL